MIQQSQILIDTQLGSQQDGHVGTSDRALKQSIIDFARAISESLAPDLVFRSDSRMPGYMLARHPDAQNQCYAIKRTASGMHHAIVLMRTDALTQTPPIELYDGDNPATAVNWCRLHALLCCMDGPTFLEEATNGIFSASHGYMLTRHVPSGCWLLMATDGTSLGSWPTAIQAELIARLHRAYA